MAKGKRDPNWKEKVLEWQASGKTCKVWSHENGISYVTLCGWKQRLKRSTTDEGFTKAGFVELKDQAQSDSGIVIEYNEVKVYVKPGFDQKVFKQCMNCLRESLC